MRLIGAVTEIPQTAIKKQIAQIIANKTIELLNEFKKRLNAAQPIQYRSNIELVGRYYNQIHPIQRDNQECSKWGCPADIAIRPDAPRPSNLANRTQRIP